MRQVVSHLYNQSPLKFLFFCMQCAFSTRQRVPIMSSLENKLDESISDFFSKAGACTTRIQCDALAGQTFGGPIKPVSLQGLYSYTVAAANDTVIVQFREPDSPLDTEILAMVRSAHPEFVAGCSFHGTIGSPPALLVYAMDKLPGDNYYTISLSMPDDGLDHQLATVRSLARFVHFLCFGLSSWVLETC